MSESPARRTFASIILVASVIPESSHENSPDAVGNRFWSCKICCWTVVIGLVREIQSSSESILLASIYRLSVSKRRAKLLPYVRSSELMRTAMGSAQCNLLRMLSALQAPTDSARQDRALASAQQTAGGKEGQHWRRQRMDYSFLPNY